jgi:hypothetical protein
MRLGKLTIHPAWIRLGGMPAPLTTTRDVIEALGGTKAAMRLTGRNDRSVSCWRVSNRFPAGTFITLNDALRAVEQSAHPGLWPTVTGRQIPHPSSAPQGPRTNLG